MSDEIFGREGGDPPNNVPRRAVRRARKLSGPTAVAVGELAFALYEITAMQVPSDTRWNMLRAKLLAWRGRYL